MDYNKYYKTNKDVFGKEPEKILVEHTHLISKEKPVLDIGAGQGRNTIYLAKLGYSVDAIDTSTISIEMLEQIKLKEQLHFNTYNSDFKIFSSVKNYSAVMLFGLIQILDWDEINLLKRRIVEWLKEGGLLFITSFTVDDDSLKVIKQNSEQIGKNSYLKNNGEKRTFFEPGEVKVHFKEFKTIHYWEGLGPEHRHGNSPPERHALVEAVFQKQ